VVVVAISGKQGSGKTTLSQALSDRLTRAGKQVFAVKFAAPVYELHDALYEAAAAYGIPPAKTDGKLLQLIGTEWGRKVHGEDVWVKAFQHTLAQIQASMKSNLANLVVINDDMRFRNEFDGTPNALKIRLRCDRDVRRHRADSWRTDEGHESETDLDLYEWQGKFDYVVDTGVQNAAWVEDQVLKFLATKGLKVY
jgi:dephospho-CoA kinase